MYEFTLSLHNALRWLVLAAAVWVVLRSFLGLRAKAYTRQDRTAGLVFTGVMDTQLLVGILLAFLSPIVQTAYANFGLAMATRELRFFAVEHLTLALLAVVFAHVGNVRSKRAAEPAAKHRQALIWYGLSVLTVVIAVPWWRPLLRF